MQVVLRYWSHLLIWTGVLFALLTVVTVVAGEPLADVLRNAGTWGGLRWFSRVSPSASRCRERCWAAPSGPHYGVGGGRRSLQLRRRWPAEADAPLLGIVVSASLVAVAAVYWGRRPEPVY